jgi:LPXTG-motif cell wall-anchored protein
LSKLPKTGSPIDMSVLFQLGVIILAAGVTVSYLKGKNNKKQHHKR